MSFLYFVDQKYLTKRNFQIIKHIFSESSLCELSVLTTYYLSNFVMCVDIQFRIQFKPFIINFLMNLSAV